MSTTQPVAAQLLLAALLGSIGCNPGVQSPDKVFSTVTAGMTVAQVEKILGPGTEVGYEQLPELYRTVLNTSAKSSAAARGAGVFYRKWSRTAGETHAVCHAAFLEGQVVDGTVYVETIKTGK